MNSVGIGITQYILTINAQVIYQQFLREMNTELAGKGFLTIPGKIPVEYFKEKWYGGIKEASI